MKMGLGRAQLFRKCLVTTLCFTSIAPWSGAQESQQQAATPVRPSNPIFFRSYKAPYVPSVNLRNSARLASLIRGGKLYLTVQDAIALAIENDIDVEVARYTPILDEWNLERAEAGGALPGVPAGATQVTSVAKGQGVRGSQAAAGVSGGGGNGGGTNTVNATVTQIGPVTPTLDPVFQDSSFFSHLSQPQSNFRQSGVSNLIDNTRNYTTSLQSGLITGGQVNLTYSESYLNENSPTNVLNPSYAPTLQATFQHDLLQRFGVAVNSRNINIDKLNLRIDDLNFRSQIISVVVNTLTLYYGLRADNEDLRAKRRAVEVAQQFYENNQKQVQLGTMAPLDITSAESQVAASQQDLVTSQVAVEQQQNSLKSVLSRTGSFDPVLANVDIVPLDRIDVPEQESFPPTRELVAKALRNRVDIAATKEHLTVDQLNNLGTASGVRPRLAVQVSASAAGQAGSPQFVPQQQQQAAAAGSQGFAPGFAACPAPNIGQTCEVADKYFVGGVTSALGQVFRRNYPTQNALAFFQAQLRNRQAQADYAIDQLTTRQDELQTQKDVNQVAVDVSNQVIALQQARVRYLAAVKKHLLEQQLLDAEQKKFALGASTSYNVVTQQRDLATAESTETAALVAYGNARIALGQTLGTTLEDTHVSVEEAKAGRVSRQSSVPTSTPSDR